MYSAHTTTKYAKHLLFLAIFGAMLFVVPTISLAASIVCNDTTPINGDSSRCFTNSNSSNASLSCNTYALGGACTCAPATSSQLSASGICNDSSRTTTGDTAINTAEKKVDAFTGWILTEVLEGIVEIIKFLNSGLVTLVGWFADLLDAAIVISLAGLSNVDAIQIGWEITRDVANIFFIFVLLVIAIATILRLEAYGAKQLLPKLIIIALLINFSLVIGAAVIDGSNILALAFIEQIDPVSDHLAVILKLPTIMSDQKPSTADYEIPWQIATSIGLPASFNLLDKGFTADPTIMNITPPANKFDALSIQLFLQLTILILMLTLCFVFISLAAMLLIRSVALIVILVLAPLGFLAGILPQTRGYSTQWWQALFNWSFFFPAASFMIYLSVVYGAQMSQLFSPSASGSANLNTGLLFNFFATVALLIGSLLVAKKMGIIGASAAIGMGMGAMRRARGYAGRMSRAGLRGAATATGVYATGRAIGDAAGAALESRLGRIPVLRGGLSRISAGREKAVQEEAKRYAHLSPKAFANMGASSALKAQAFSKYNADQKEQFMQALKPAQQTAFGEVADHFGGKKLRREAAKATGDLHQAMRMLHPSEFGEMAQEPVGNPRYEQRTKDFLDTLTSKEIGALNTATIQNSNTLRDYIFETSKDMKEMFGKRENLQAFSTNIRSHMYEKGMISPAEVAQEIENKGNKELAEEFRQDAAKNIGINIILRPEKMRTGTKRGVVRQVTAEEGP